MLIKDYMIKGIRCKNQITKNNEHQANMVVYLKEGRMVEIWINKFIDAIIFETVTDYKKIKKNEIKELNDITRELKNGMRFSYKECSFQMPYEYIEDEEKYKERAEKGIKEKEISKIIKNYEKSKITKELLKYLEITEEETDVLMYCIGENELMMCEKLKEKGLIEYQKMGEIYAKVEIKGNERSIDRMLVLSKELKRNGYNFWLNYED